MRLFGGISRRLRASREMAPNSLYVSLLIQSALPNAAS